MLRPGGGPGGTAAVGDLGARMTLRKALKYGNVPEAAVRELDEKLRKITVEEP